MNHTRRTLSIGVPLAGLLGLSGAAWAKGKPKHHNGAKLAGEKIKKDGKHILEKKGPHTVSLEVKKGKIAGMHVKHASKGDVAVKKYQTKKKMAQADTGLVTVAYVQVQDQYLGITYIGYSYYDDFGDEYVYWFPYDMILDGDTGAVEYVAAY